MKSRRLITSALCSNSFIGSVSLLYETKFLGVQQHPRNVIEALGLGHLLRGPAKKIALLAARHAVENGKEQCIQFLVLILGLVEFLQDHRPGVLSSELRRPADICHLPECTTTSENEYWYRCFPPKALPLVLKFFRQCQNICNAKHQSPQRERTRKHSPRCWPFLETKRNPFS